MLHRVEIHSSLDAASQPRVFARLLVGNYAIFEPILTLHLLNSRHPVNKSKFCAWAVMGSNWIVFLQRLVFSKTLTTNTCCQGRIKLYPLLSL